MNTNFSIVSVRSLKIAYIGKGKDDKRIFLKVYDEHNPKLKLRIGKGAPDFPGMDKGYKL